MDPVDCIHGWQNLRDLPTIAYYINNIIIMFVGQEQNRLKEQIIHTETLNMMAKYQLIFLKMETHMRKLVLNLNLKLNQQKMMSWRKLKNNASTDSRQLKVVVNAVFEKFKQVDRIVQRRTKINLIFAFQKLRFQFPKSKNDKIRKSFLQVIASKDAEIKNLQVKEQEIRESISQQKLREQEVQQKLKQKDQQLQQLEVDLKKSTVNRTLDSRLRCLEIENQEMQERIVGTEDSVSLFIREMNELLDSHEISTNLDSDDNGSYEQPNLEYQSQRVNQNQRQPKPKNFYSNQLTRSTKIN